MLISTLYPNLLLVFNSFLLGCSIHSRALVMKYTSMYHCSRVQTDSIREIFLTRRVHERNCHFSHIVKCISVMKL